MESAIERILTQFTTGGWKGIESLPSSRGFETMHLEFKLPELANGQLGKSDRKNLSKALSGFANSDGGLIVWGVRAKPDEDGFDRIQGVQQIANLGRFISELNAYEPHLVSPLVPNVRHISIADPGNPDCGIAVSAIPASDAAPHMANGKNLHCYFRRCGASFMAMKHHEIADLFGRRPHPDLELSCSWQVRVDAKVGGVADTVSLELHLTFVNRGRGCARFSSLSLAEPQGLQAATLGGHKIQDCSVRIVRGAKHWWVRAAASSDELVYPQDELSIGHVSFRLGKGRRIYPDVRVEYSIVCADSPAKTGELKVAGSSIQDAANSVLKGGLSRVTI